MTFTTNEQVLADLQQACEDVDFVLWEGTRNAAYVEMQLKKSSYDGVLIVGGLDGDYRLAFTGLPTITVYNLWEFMNQPWDLFATGKMPEDPVLKGGCDYTDVRILTAQLDRRNLCAPPVSEKMFQDLVYKVKLIKAIKELKETRILMVKNAKNEIIASVNYRGDLNQTFPPDHNERYLDNFKKYLEQRSYR